MGFDACPCQKTRIPFREKGGKGDTAAKNSNGQVSSLSPFLDHLVRSQNAEVLQLWDVLADDEGETNTVYGGLAAGLPNAEDRDIVPTLVREGHGEQSQVAIQVGTRNECHEV